MRAQLHTWLATKAVTVVCVAAFILQSQLRSVSLELVIA